jgi:Acetyltransferase (GNAT) domain
VTQPLRTTASVKVLRTLEELDGIRSEWGSWPGNRDSEMDSYLTFLRSNPTTVRPHVLVVHREGRPDAILVGRIDLGHISCRLGYLRLNLPAKTLCFVYGAFRGNPSKENCDLIVSSVLQSLSDREADVAYMNFLREDSELCRLAKKEPGVLSRDYLHVTQQHYAAALPASVDEFYRGLSPKVRKNQKRQAKKLVDHFSGNITVRCFRKVAEIENLVADVGRIASRSYQRGLGVGFFDCPHTREQLRLKAEKGWLHGYVLYLAERPCAFWIGDVNGNTFGSDYVGYDPEFANHSPGMYLVMRVIEGFCDGHREGVTGVDFGPGHAQYKQVLSNQEWWETCVYIFAPTVKGISLNLARTLIVGIDQMTKKALARTNLLQKAKRAWRNHAAPKEVVRTDA